MRTLTLTQVVASVAAATSCAVAAATPAQAPAVCTVWSEPEAVLTLPEDRNLDLALGIDAQGRLILMTSFQLAEDRTRSEVRLHEREAAGSWRAPRTLWAGRAAEGDVPEIKVTVSADDHALVGWSNANVTRATVMPHTPQQGWLAPLALPKGVTVMPSMAVANGGLAMVVYGINHGGVLGGYTQFDALRWSALSGWGEAEFVDRWTAHQNPYFVDVQDELALNPSGQAVWVYGRGRPESWRYYQSRLRAATFQPGQGWAPAQWLQDRGWISSGENRPRAAIDDRGRAMVAWSAQDNAANRRLPMIQTRLYDPALGGWLAVQTVSEPGARHLHAPQLRMTPGGDAVVAWHRSAQRAADMGPNRPQLATRRADEAWSSAQTVRHQDVEAEQVKLALDDWGQVWMAWRTPTALVSGVLGPRGATQLTTHNRDTYPLGAVTEVAGSGQGHRALAWTRLTAEGQQALMVQVGLPATDYSCPP